jgi:PAS domain S-box-containing protein
MQNHKIILKEGFLKDSLLKIRKNDSSFFYGSFSAMMIYENQTTPKYIIGITRDITDEKRIKSEFKKNREMFQLVLDNIPQFIFWKDIDSVYLGCNKNFARVAGVGDPQNIIGKTDYNLPWNQSQKESFYEVDRLVMESDKPEYHIIEQQLQADGKEAWLDMNKIPLHNSKGEVVGLLGTYEDITERVLAEKAIEKSEKKYRHLFDNSPLAIILIDLEGNIIDINETVQKLFPEQTKESLLDLNIFDWIAINNEDKVPFFRKILQAFIKGDMNDYFVVKLNRRNKNMIWINTYLSLLTIEEKNFIQVILQDITDRKLAR